MRRWQAANRPKLALWLTPERLEPRKGLLVYRNGAAVSPAGGRRKVRGGRDGCAATPIEPRGGNGVRPTSGGHDGAAGGEAHPMACPRARGCVGCRRSTRRRCVARLVAVRFEPPNA